MYFSVDSLLSMMTMMLFYSKSYRKENSNSYHHIGIQLVHQLKIWYQSCLLLIQRRDTMSINLWNIPGSVKLFQLTNLMQLIRILKKAEVKEHSKLLDWLWLLETSQKKYYLYHSQRSEESMQLNKSFFFTHNGYLNRFNFIRSISTVLCSNHV